MPIGKSKLHWPPWKNHNPSSPRPTAGLSSTADAGSPQLTQSAPPSFRELPKDLEEGDNTYSSPKPSSSGFATPRTEAGLSHQPSTLFGPPINRVDSPKSEPPLTPADLRRTDFMNALTVNQAGVRPWKDTPRHHWFVTTEQMMMHDETRKRVAQAVSCGLSLAGDATYNALFLGVKVMEFSPVPGLESCGKVLLQIWDTMQQVALNRMRCLRLAMRAADLMISIRGEISRLDDVVGRELQHPLNNFEDTLMFVLKTLHRQITLPGWIRYLRRDELSDEIDNCNVALGDCLGSFDRSVMLRIIDNIVTRRQSTNVPLLLQPEEQEEPLKPQLDELDIPISDLPLPTGMSASQDGQTIWQQLIEQDDEADNARDERDYNVLLEHATLSRDEAEVIRLLQIGHAELPRALKGLLKEAFELRRARDQEKGSHRDGHSLENKRARSETWPPDAFAANEAKTASPARGHGGGGGRLRRSSTRDSESVFQWAESVRREHRGLPSVVRSWAVAREDIRLGDIIGRGRFSTVYKGIWRGRTVAVKVLNPNMVSINEFDNELTVWRSLSVQAQGGGGNVLKLYGSSSFTGGLPRMLLSPYMRHGSLSDYLNRCEWEAMGESPALFLQPGSYHKVDHLRIMHDIARGMEFIHSSGVLHGDLRASNVLVTDHFRCIISDFGSSRRKQDITIYEDPPPPHSLRWQPPEIIGGRSLMTEHVDVYAYAMTCIEVVTFGNWPWPGLSDDEVRDAVLKKRSRPLIHDLITSLCLEGLLHSCWHDAPASRPTFKDVVQLLQRLRYPTPG